MVSEHSRPSIMDVRCAEDLQVSLCRMLVPLSLSIVYSGESASGMAWQWMFTRCVFPDTSIVVASVAVATRARAKRNSP